MNAIPTSTPTPSTPVDAVVIGRRAVPLELESAAAAIGAGCAVRLERMARHLGHGFITEAPYTEFRPGHRRRQAAAWKIVSHHGIVLRADVYTDDDGATMVARVDGQIVAIAERPADAVLVIAINKSLDAIGVCA